MKIKPPIGYPMPIPERVIVDSQGYAVSPKDARAMVKPLEIIFKRNDGWTLAAPSEFVLVAYRLWATEWTHFFRDGQWRRICEFSPEFEGSVIY